MPDLLMKAIEEEIVALKNQLANFKEEYRAVTTEHDNEARMYRATIDNLRTEASRLATLAEGRDTALTLAINQRDQAMDLLRHIDRLLVDFIRPTKGT